MTETLGEVLSGLLGIVVLVVLAVLFFLPTVVAIRNPKGRYQGAAVLVNVLLGWTGLFWVIALILAVQGPQQAVVVREPLLVPPTSDGWYPDPYRRYEHRYFDGQRWTADVSTGGSSGVDPLTQ